MRYIHQNRTFNKLDQLHIFLNTWGKRFRIWIPVEVIKVYGIWGKHVDRLTYQGQVFKCTWSENLRKKCSICQRTPTVSGFPRIIWFKICKHSLQCLDILRLMNIMLAWLGFFLIKGNFTQIRFAAWQTSYILIMYDPIPSGLLEKNKF